MYVHSTACRFPSRALRHWRCHPPLGFSFGDYVKLDHGKSLRLRQKAHTKKKTGNDGLGSLNIKAWLHHWPSDGFLMLVDRVQAPSSFAPFRFTSPSGYFGSPCRLGSPYIGCRGTFKTPYSAHVDVLRCLACCACVCKSCAPVTPTDDLNQQRESHNKRDRLRRSQARQSQNTPGSTNSVSPFLHHLSLLSICTYPHGLPPAISSVSFPFFIQKGQISPARVTRKLISGIWNQGIKVPLPEVGIQKDTRAQPSS